MNVTTAETFRFGDLELHGSLLSWDADGGAERADFHYLKRNGAETEPLGAKQKKFSFRCTLLAANTKNNVSAEFISIVSKLERRPRDVLIHPRLGRIKACFDTWQASEDPASAVDELTLTLTFVEDGTDQALTAIYQPGPSERAGQVGESQTTMNTAVEEKYNDPAVDRKYAVYTATQTYSALATSFTVAALQAAQSTVYDPGLLQRLNQLAAQRDLVLTALTESLLHTLQPDTSLTPYRVAVRGVYASAVELYNSVIAQKPPVISFTVPSSMSFFSALVRVYGPDAKGKLAEARMLNPHLVTPLWIPGGTILQLSAPVVRQ